MRYILVAIPEGRQPGVPGRSGKRAVICTLPEGTHSLDIQAYWSVTGEDGRFRGGAAGFKAGVQEREAS
jgi:hypothetical protein